MKNTFLISVLILLFGCQTTTKLSNKNLSYIYWDDAITIDADFKVYHASDTASVLYCSIDPNGLLFSREDERKGFTATFTMSYKLFPSFESKELLDSASETYTYSKNDHKKELIKTLYFKASKGKNYLIEASLFDVKRRQYSKAFIRVVKEDLHTSQSYLIKPYEKNQISFTNVLHENDLIDIVFANKAASTMRMKFYGREFPIAKPPFSLQGQQYYIGANSKLGDNNADSIINVSVEKIRNEGITIKNKGVYFFQSDTALKTGLSVFRFEDDYPFITKVDQMLKPLRYITTKQEYSEMSVVENKKHAIDDFWLKITGNPDRGKKIIKKYYSRVQAANKHFASYLDGWKTDRGMIYIVYGPPDVVYKGSTMESWTYGEEGNLISLNFTFLKVPNPISDNDFVLDRSPIYKNSWYLAVDAWRQGIIY
jgi:GWxTD domain-containing protein